MVERIVGHINSFPNVYTKRITIKAGGSISIQLSRGDLTHVIRFSGFDLMHSRSAIPFLQRINAIRSTLDKEYEMECD